MGGVSSQTHTGDLWQTSPARPGRMLEGRAVPDCGVVSGALALTTRSPDWTQILPAPESGPVPLAIRLITFESRLPQSNFILPPCCRVHKEMLC